MTTITWQLVERLRALTIVAILIFSALPVSGLDAPVSEVPEISEIPKVRVNTWEDLPWWETTSRDLNRNGIVDWLEQIEDEYKVGVLYDDELTDDDFQLLDDIGLDVKYHVTMVNGLLLGSVNSSLFETISDLPGDCS